MTCCDSQRRVAGSSGFRYAYPPRQLEVSPLPNRVLNAIVLLGVLLQPLPPQRRPLATGLSQPAAARARTDFEAAKKKIGHGAPTRRAPCRPCGNRSRA